MPEVALAERDTECVKDPGVFIGLDAFGNDAQFEGSGQLRQRRDNRQRTVISGHGPDELLVDLDHADRHLDDASERAVSGSVIVGSKTNAASRECFEFDEEACVDFGEVCLGQLQHQLFRR